ncbi:MFS transporter [Zavarzinia compransoris]|uniref:MFS transporter n=1 Tax=Zavarzinia compransoris TaxID=1264899 RepID=A0A317DZK6_9PROT|nr:MFS transporter [Zavarzinia compransoris]PWR19861.1 MFS transporter [Zavarzinia compransoris]TDP45028.1 FSR family fosmidomycin resistance protein-like MFS transporter [Zavarzinia compransoris]
MSDTTLNPAGREPSAAGATLMVLLAISFCHMVNDLLQSLLPAIYPMLKDNFALTFSQIGLVTFTYQMTGSILQPVVGIVTDKYPKPYSLVVGMGLTMGGLVLISQAWSYSAVLAGAALLGTGSSIFHPEASRIARLSSGGRHGFAQSLFQVGGNAGSAIGPLLAAFVILPNGQSAVAWFAGVALVGMSVLWQIGTWYGPRRALGGKPKRASVDGVTLGRGQVAGAMAVLIVLMFSKFIYMSSFQSYYTFFLIHRFGLGIEEAQLRLFVFLGAVAVGTIAGGPIGDRIGRKYVIWGSILGVLPFTLALPYASLFWTGVLSVIVGLVLSSAFSAIVVYGQELMPGRVGMVAGLFFGFAFGLGGLGAAVLGRIADATSIEYVYTLCSYLPALGILTVFLPTLKERR